MPQYVHAYFLSPGGVPLSGSGGGRNLDYLPRDLLQEVNTYATQYKCGSHVEKGQPLRDQDIFAKFTLAPYTTEPAAPTVPPGSLIDSAVWRQVSVGGNAAAHDVFIAAVSRTAAASTVDPQRNWSHDAPRYAQSGHWSVSSRIKHLGVVVNLGGVGPGGVHYAAPNRITINNNGVWGVSQKHLINLEADAKFDAIEIHMSAVGQPGNGWFEAWTEDPTGYQSPTYGQGTLLGATTPRTMTSLTGGVAQTFTFPSVIDAGSGAQYVSFWFVQDDDAASFAMDYTWEAGDDHLHYRATHRTGGNGLSYVPYMTNRDYPNISGPEDDTLNGNEVGTVLAYQIPGTGYLAAWSIPDIKTLVQEAIGETGYVDTHSILLTVAHKNSAVHYGLGIWSQQGGQQPTLTVTWTPPPTIESFTAEPSPIYVGDGSVLRWQTTDSDLTTIDNGVGTVSGDGQEIVYPTVTTLYTLTAWSLAGEVTAQVTVTVDPKNRPLFSPNETSIANAGLVLLGERRIDSLNDESKTAKLIAEVFGELRDQLLRVLPWNFATRRATLALSAEKPAFGFGHYYQLPQDCLRLLEVDNPVVQEYRVEGRRVATNISPPLNITYTARVEDPLQMDVLYRDTLSAYIAFTLAEAVTGDSEKASQVLAIFEDRMGIAKTTSAQESRPRRIGYSDHEQARGKLED